MHTCRVVYDVTVKKKHIGPANVIRAYVRKTRLTLHTLLEPTIHAGFRLAGFDYYSA
jgi:hypothetical protein